MKKLKFSKDEGSAFYTELLHEVDIHFNKNGISKSGNRKMYFKMVMYFSLNIILYQQMITSSSPTLFVIFYLLMGLSVLLTAFNVSHDACHGVAVKSKFWNNFLFQLSFNLQGNNAYVWGKNHNESHHAFTNVEAVSYTHLTLPTKRIV